jgi:hypothetical protein
VSDGVLPDPAFAIFRGRTGTSERVARIGFDLSLRSHGLVGRSVTMKLHSPRASAVIRDRDIQVGAIGASRLVCASPDGPSHGVREATSQPRGGRRDQRWRLTSSKAARTPANSFQRLMADHERFLLQLRTERTERETTPRPTSSIISCACTTETPALDVRIFEPYGVRVAAWTSLSGCQQNRVQLPDAIRRWDRYGNVHSSSFSVPKSCAKEHL